MPTPTTPRERWAQEFGRRKAEVIAEFRTAWTSLRLNKDEGDEEAYAAEVAGAGAHDLLAAAKNREWRTAA